MKLGGSLASSPELRGWLAAISGGGGRLVLVPGGGPFADQVREAQRRWSFGDATAHRLAIMAMEQYGFMLAGLEPRLRPSASRAAIQRVLAAGGVPVWLPTRMALGRPEIPESWDVTSDSLAAWLAADLAADGVLLVKSVAVAPGSTVDDLARRGIVDPLFPGFIAGVPACRVIEASRHDELRRALAGGEMAGVSIVTAPAEPG